MEPLSTALGYGNPFLTTLIIIITLLLLLLYLTLTPLNYPCSQVVFRSASAQMFLFIQISSEMWEFDASGTIMLMTVIWCQCVSYMYVCMC